VGSGEKAAADPKPLAVVAKLELEKKKPLAAVSTPYFLCILNLIVKNLLSKVIY